MKKIRYLLFTAWCALLMAQPDNKSSGVILLQQKEAEEIFSSSVPYVYFGSEVSSLVADLPNIEHDLGNTDVYHDDLSTLCKRIAQGDTTAPLNTVVAALTQARDHLHCNNHDDSCALLAHNIETMLNTVASGHLTIGISTDTLPDVTDTLLRAPREDGTSASCCPKPCNNPYLNANCLLLEHNALIKGNVSIAGDERVCGSVLICNNLTVNGNETVHGDLTVTGTLFATVTPIFFADLELIGTPQERCIIFYDALMNEKARICDYPTAGEHGLFISVDGGVTQNVQVNNGGGVVIDAPTSGDALAVTGNTGSPAIVATGNSTTTTPSFQFINNPAASAPDFFFTINSAGDITESTLTTSNFIANGCQSGPITIGTANASSVILATNGCTPRLTIDQNGAVSIATPSAGTGLTVNGGGVVVAAPSAGDALAVTGNTGSPAIVATGHGTTTAPALQLLNNPAASATDFFLTINAAGDVTESTLTTSNFIANGCQTGPITIGTANASSVTVATNGCTPRVTIDQNGAVSIATPSAGTGLTVNGGGVVIDAPTSGDALMVTGNTGSPAIVAIGNSTTTAPALQLLNNPAASATDFFLTINAAGDVTESTLTTSNFIANGCQSGPITIGTANASSVILATNGCTPRLTIDQNGAVSIATPSAGTGLTVSGSGETISAGNLNISTGNIMLPSTNSTGKQGLFELGTSASNIVLYKFWGRNFFAGNYTATNTGVTGTDNISFGSNTNSTLTTANYVIAIGDDAVATGTDSIAIGDKAKATALRTIVLGSKDSTSTGAAPTATALNAIAIGSANGTNAGASATGISAIAIGGADAASAKGAAAAGNRAIALGTNASSTGILSIAVGSASGTAGGTGPSTTGGATNAIVIGSANSAIAGASSNSVAAIGIGGSDGVFTGATADGIRTIAIGVAALAQSDSGVLIGSASGTAGGVGPNAVNRAAICIGSASGALRAANSGNISTIAIGGSDGVFAGASALGGRCIAIGQNASVPNAGAGSIALGSSSGAVGGTAPTVSGATSVAIGSANGALSGPSATGAGAVVIGASDGIASGASATANRSVAIGTGATATLADNVIFGNSASTNMRVGIGSNTPTSRLHVVGANGTPIITINQVAVAIGNAPIWKNPSVSAIAGTPIHYNASNHLFGFTSSKRYKTNIRDVLNESDILYTLTPVIYDSKPEFGSGNNIPGFIAEDVYEVAPNLVILNSDGEPENVAYNYLHALVIKEIQKHALQLSILSISLQDNQDSLNALETQVASLNTQLNQLEICVVNKKTGRDISSG